MLIWLIVFRLSLSKRSATHKEHGWLNMNIIFVHFNTCLQVLKCFNFRLFFIFALVTATPSSDFCIFSPTSSAWSKLAMSLSAAGRPLDNDGNDDTSTLNGLCWSTHSRSFTISFVSCVDLDVLDTCKMLAICKPGHRFMYSSTMMNSTRPLVPYVLSHATASRKPPWDFIDHMRTCSMHRSVHKPPQYL